MPTHTSHAPPSLHVEMIPAARLQPLAWKNAGGITREIACHPRGAGFDAFEWRASLADVARAGPFSTFAGIDRTIVLTAGDAMTLVDSQSHARHRLRRWEPYRFAGEAPVHAELPSGPTQDFNLMLRRGTGTGCVAVHATGQTLSLAAGTMLLHCAAGSFGVTPADTDWPATVGSNVGDGLPESRAAEANEAVAHSPAGKALPACGGRSKRILRTGDTLLVTLGGASGWRLAIEPMETGAQLIDARIGKGDAA